MAEAFAGGGHGHYIARAPRLCHRLAQRRGSRRRGQKCTSGCGVATVTSESAVRTTITAPGEQRAVPRGAPQRGESGGERSR
jgi:hypothetical protein